jgi:uncharacterized membrane protein YadS
VAVGLLVSSLAVLLSHAAHALASGIGVLTWGIVIGVTAANVGRLPPRIRRGVAMTARWCLRWGIVLLGFSLPLGTLHTLGAPVVASVAVVLAATFLCTLWLAGRLGVGRGRGLLMAAGFAVCGASAVAAMESSARADEDDVAGAIGMVTVWGTVSMVTLPLLGPMLGLAPAEYAVWTGASVHEVGQVVAAAGSAGTAVVTLAVAVKLTRVLLLAPLIAVVGAVQRWRPEGGPLAGGAPTRTGTGTGTSDGDASRTGASGGGTSDGDAPGRASGSAAAGSGHPPLVPWFVLGFVACVLVGSVGVVPAAAHDILAHAQTVALCAGLFGLGTGVRVATLFRGGTPLLCLGGLATAFVTVAALLATLAAA